MHHFVLPSARELVLININIIDTPTPPFILNKVEIEYIVKFVGFFRVCIFKSDKTCKILICGYT